jgi:hypothetical protein
MRMLNWTYKPFEWPAALDQRADKVPNAPEMLVLFKQSTAVQAMLEAIAAGKKPHVAASPLMIEAFGLEAARADALRRLAGWAIAHAVESQGAERREKGSPAIIGDPVFASGQGFVLPPAMIAGIGEDVFAALGVALARVIPGTISEWSEPAVEALWQIVDAERARRASPRRAPSSESRDPTTVPSGHRP